MISTVIATIGRSTLARAVESVLQQDCAVDFEVIVVNDSGQSLPMEEWQRSPRVTIIHTDRLRPCIARNTGAAIARGAYLHFLDDDDYMLPGAFRELWSVAQAGNASLTYGATQFVDGKGNPTWQFHLGESGDLFTQVMSHHWVPTVSSLIKRESFWRAGGYDPVFHRMGEQKDLVRRISLHGHFANTPMIVSCVVQDRANSTADHDLSSDASVWSRERILDRKGSFRRMWASARTAYWRGMLVRAYLTCVAWNLRKGNMMKTLSRAGGGTAGFILSARSIPSRSFWRGLRGYNHSKASG